VKFKQYTHEDYQAVCDFLITLNQQDKMHINWNWARWEWMFQHPYFDHTLQDTIGLWWDDDRIVGAAIYDLYHGEAFCGALKGFKYILPEILEYAYNNLKDDNGLGIAVHDGNRKMHALLSELGYQPADQTETILRCSLEKEQDYVLPNDLTIREIHFPEDSLTYQTVIWKGFDHEGDDKELEKMLGNKFLPPHRRQDFCLALVDGEGEFAAHCTCWYDERTDYAYVEPICTIPKYRGMGLGKAIILEALNRCRNLGAKEAFVISEQEFYKKLGFEPHSHYTFYWKCETGR